MAKDNVDNKNCLANSSITENNRVFLDPIHPKWLYGFGLSMFEYLTCNLKFIVNLTNTLCENIMDPAYICLAKKDLDPTRIGNQSMTPVYQDYLTELLSVLKQDEVTDHFSYIELFSHEVWLAIIVAILVSSSTLYFGHQTQVGLLYLTRCLCQILIRQPVVLFKKLFRSCRGFYILLFVWILSTNFLTMSFTSILLKTYFKTKPSLTAHTFEDIVDNPDLYVSGRRALNTIKRFKRDVYRELRKRLLEYEARVGINTRGRNGTIGMHSQRVIQDVIHRRVVLIVDSFETDNFKKLYPKFNFHESDHKFNQRFSYSTVHKTQPFYRSIQTMLKACYESGISSKSWHIWTDTSYIFGQMNQDHSDCQDLNQISLYKMFKGPFMFIILGQVASIVCLLWEKTKISLNKWIKRRVFSYIFTHE